MGWFDFTVSMPPSEAKPVERYREKWKTSNIQHSTFNAQRPTTRHATPLNVEC
jgi:hypothetical protein